MQAVIEFGLDGTVLKANDNFLGLFGYTLEELKGQHHMLMVATEHRDSDAYRGYCDAMARGETSVAQQKQVAKGGSEVVMQVACTPVLDDAGNPQRLVALSPGIIENRRAWRWERVGECV